MIKMENDPITKRSVNYLKDTRLGRIFLDRKFFNYTWIGILISLLNIFLLWLFIDIFQIPTIIASTIVVGMTFILRYILLTLFKIF
jgi:putative flippase GtrA